MNEPFEISVTLETLMKGPKGDTPVKGVDYFTQEEIDEFKDDVATKAKFGIDQLGEKKKAEILAAAAAEKLKITEDVGALSAGLHTLVQAETTGAVETINTAKNQAITAMESRGAGLEASLDSKGQDLRVGLNDAASGHTSTFNANAQQKTQAFNGNASTQTTAFNTNASVKFDEYNANAQQKIQEMDEKIHATDGYDAKLRDHETRIGVLEAGAGGGGNNHETKFVLAESAGDDGELAASTNSPMNGYITGVLDKLEPALDEIGGLSYLHNENKFNFMIDNGVDITVSFDDENGKVDIPCVVDIDDILNMRQGGYLAVTSKHSFEYDPGRISVWGYIVGDTVYDDGYYHLQPNTIMVSLWDEESDESVAVDRIEVVLDANNSANVDLSDYYTKKETDEKIDEKIADKTDRGEFTDFKETITQTVKMVDDNQTGIAKSVEMLFGKFETMWDDSSVSFPLPERQNVYGTVVFFGQNENLLDLDVSEIMVTIDGRLKYTLPRSVLNADIEEMYGVLVFQTVTEIDGVEHGWQVLVNPSDRNKTVEIFDFSPYSAMFAVFEGPTPSTVAVSFGEENNNVKTVTEIVNGVISDSNVINGMMENISDLFEDSSFFRNEIFGLNEILGEGLEDS